MSLYPSDLRVYLLSIYLCVLKISKDVLRLQLLPKVVLGYHVWDQLVVHEGIEGCRGVDLLS